MNNIKHDENQLIIFAYGWPSDYSGYGIALRSSLSIYENYFDKIVYVFLTDKAPETIDYVSKKIVWVHVPIVRKRPWFRFIMSILSKDPAIVAQYKSKNIKNRLHNLVSHYLKEKNIKTYIIFEGVAISYCKKYIEQDIVGVPSAIRSHDVLYKAFVNLKNNNFFPLRLIWSLEILRIKAFESNICSNVDMVWAITDTDRDDYFKYYNIECTGIFGAYVNPRKYMSAKKGSIDNVIYIGSADLRKGNGLKRFIDKSWCKIIKEYPRANLIIAGKNTEKISNKRLHIFGLGYVNDDLSLLDQGLIFINPQESGSGLQLKSIVSMLSGKALVSTDTGIKGINGKNGYHYFCSTDAEGLAELVLYFMRNEDIASEVSVRAKDFIIKEFNYNRLFEQTKNLMNSYIQYDCHSE